MKIAVTNHAVNRYLERVEGAKGFYRESIRHEIRLIVENGFREGLVRPHPQGNGKRIIPFQSGGSVLFLSIGCNFTSIESDLAVISVLYEHEMTEGKVGMGVTLGDLFPGLKREEVTKSPPQYVMFVGDAETTIEQYKLQDEAELRSLLDSRRPRYEDVSLYRLIE